MRQIEIKSDLQVKASPDCKPIKHKAVAGLSEAELIERHTIGNYDKEEDQEEEVKEETNRG